ncbi:hypothetical protein O6H91_17G079400 [Diphasiastrum complanatum]|uniref:Uncharacterized protein n=1 Tax=Diphasiastrum complanatum TaxID=34168 RepID=A0ACC2B8H3_DIPCM|nr:hypothetical protein O6H91_17G079400 [Diphasiastrum complanatum]
MAIVMTAACLSTGHTVDCPPTVRVQTSYSSTSFVVPFLQIVKFRKPIDTFIPRRTNQTISVGAISSTGQEMQTLRYRKLGDSDLVISEVILGTMTWGVQNSEKDAHEQLSYAFDNGVNVLDTAEAYPVPPSKETQGRTDQYIASWLKERPRDKVIVATKVSGYSERQSYLRAKAKMTRVDADNIKESVENSLSRLGTDYIDLLQIHWPDRYVPLFGEFLYDVSRWRVSVPFDEQLRALQTVINEGKVRYIGVSNETSYGVMEFVHAAKALGLPKIGAR